jgi:hypothetical protein
MALEAVPMNSTNQNLGMSSLLYHIAMFNNEDVLLNRNSDLLLGRPWERAVRATADNMDNGELIVTIRSPDGRREAKFVPVHY